MDITDMNIVNVHNESTEINQQKEGRLPCSTMPSKATISSSELPNGDLASLQCKNGVKGEQTFTFAWYNELLIVLSMVLYVADIGTDIYIAYNSHLAARDHEEM